MFVQPLLQWKNNEYYTDWMCIFVALGIQHAMPMSHIVVYGLARSTIFSHIIYKQYDFRTKTLLNTKMCVLIFSTTLPETFLILRRNERNMMENL